MGQVSHRYIPTTLVTRHGAILNRSGQATQSLLNLLGSSNVLEVNSCLTYAIYATLRDFFFCTQSTTKDNVDGLG